MESAPTGVRKRRHKQKQTETNRQRKGRGEPGLFVWVDVGLLALGYAVVVIDPEADQLQDIGGADSFSVFPVLDRAEGDASKALAKLGLSQACAEAYGFDLGGDVHHAELFGVEI